MNKAACCFFGHRDTPDTILSDIRETVRKLISEGHIHLFYVGNRGAFDRLVYQALCALRVEFPHISVFVVLSRVGELTWAAPEDTIFPEEAAMAPPRFAISYCNRWMLNKVGTVVVYITRSYGGAYSFAQIAERKGKAVVNLAQKSRD